MSLFDFGVTVRAKSDNDAAGHQPARNKRPAAAIAEAKSAAAAAPVASPPSSGAAGESSSSASSSLTAEQRARMEQNRLAALAKRRKAALDFAALLTEPSWQAVLAPQFDLPYMRQLALFLAEEKKRGAVVYPPDERIFAALNAQSIDEIRVVILGQDPYHQPNQAIGFAFAVNDGITLPPSLRNIYKELEDDVDGFVAPRSGDLSGWAAQGVLLLNTALTVRRGEPNSHAKDGAWAQFTDHVIRAVCARHSAGGLVFVLWGRHAQQKRKLISSRGNLVISSAHPSPLSATKGFFGSKPFSRTNEFLRKAGRTPVNWKQTKKPAPAVTQSVGETKLADDASKAEERDNRTNQAD